MPQISNFLIFCITVFIALTFTNAGLYLTDELSPANQLHQLAEGHQLTYFEDKYGFYGDGTIDKYITNINYVMIYSLMLPVISLPIFLILSLLPDIAGVLPLILWILILGYLILTFKERISKMYIYCFLGIITILNIIFYTKFNVNSLEVLSIVTTNVLLYGLFGVIIWKLICHMFAEDKRIFMWIATMSCSSLLFWVGALKDHVLVALLLIIILYTIIKFYDAGEIKYLLYTAVASGLIVWERPELSITIIPMVCLLILYKKFYAKPLIVYGIITLLCTIPSLLNNYIVTGSIFKFPLQAVKQTIGGAHLSSSSNAIDILLHEIPTYIMINFSNLSFNSIVGIMMYPFNGGIGVLPIIMPAIFTIIFLPYLIYIKKIRVSNPEKILFIFSIAITVSYFCISALGFNLHAETGMLPDMRLFSLIYAPITIASLSVISRSYNLNYKIMLQRVVISIGIVLFIFVSMLMFTSNIITSLNINFVANCIGFIIFAISIAGIVNIKLNRIDELEIIIPIMVALPLVWQILVSVITTKLYNYPMYIPLIELIKQIVFG